MTTGKAIQKYEQSLQQMVERFGSLFAKDSQQEELAKLHKMIELGFDPRLGHMGLYENKLILYHVGAMWWKNQQDPDRRFGIVHRIIQKDDKELYGLENGDIGVIAQLLDYRNGGVIIAEGFGKANPLKPHRAEKVPQEKRQYLPEVKFPFIMAQKRGECQLIKRGFPLGIDIGTMADEDNPNIINGELSVIEEETGEIKETPPAKPTQHPDLDKCPQHGVSWIEGKHGYGRWHNLDDGTKCNLRKALMPDLVELWATVGTGVCNDWLKEHFSGKTWSGLSDENTIAAIEKLREIKKTRDADKEGDRSVARPEGEAPGGNKPEEDQSQLSF